MNDITHRGALKNDNGLLRQQCQQFSYVLTLYRLCKLFDNNLLKEHAHRNTLSVITVIKKALWSDANASNRTGVVIRFLHVVIVDNMPKNKIKLNLFFNRSTISS